MPNSTVEKSKLVVRIETETILSKLREFLLQHNIESYLVGGFVRDSLLGRDNSDIDIAVGSDAVIIASEVAHVLGGRMVLLDEVHQTARVVLSRDEEHFHVDFSTMHGNIEEDLRIRDFTVNAISFSLAETEEGWPTVHMIDPLGGYHDLGRKLIRAVNKASFQQDPARLLRAVRFAAELAFDIDPATEELISRDHSLLATVAGERLRDEFCYILETSKAYSSLRCLDRLSLLTSLLPELEDMKEVVQPKEHFWDVFNHTLQTVAAVERLFREETSEDEILAPVPWSPDIAHHFTQEISKGRTRKALLKLAALLHDIAKPITKTIEQNGRMRFLGHPQEGVKIVGQIMERLRFANREIRIVQLMVENHLRPGQLANGEMPSHRAIYRYFRDTADASMDILFLSLADHLATRGPELNFANWCDHAKGTQYMLFKWFEEKTVVEPPKLIDGHTLMDKFTLAPGPKLGEFLEAVREAQAEGEISTAEEALDLVARKLKRG
ncbi:CCA tRNA nucleotidyltransferase [Chloroflexota bacterium]